MCCIAWGQITQQRVSSLAQLNCSSSEWCARVQWQTIHEIHQCSRDPTKKKKAIWKFWRSRHHDFLLRNLSIHASMTPICCSSSIYRRHKSSSSWFESGILEIYFGSILVLNFLFFLHSSTNIPLNQDNINDNLWRQYNAATASYKCHDCMNWQISQEKIMMLTPTKFFDAGLGDRKYHLKYLI